MEMWMEKDLVTGRVTEKLKDLVKETELERELRLRW